MKITAPIVSEGVVIFNDQGQILLITPGANQLFGYGDHELVGMAVGKLIPDAYPVSHLTASTTSTAVTGKRKDGSELSIEMSLCPFGSKSELFTVAFVSESVHRSEPGLMRMWNADRVSPDGNIDLSDSNPTPDLVHSLAHVEKINRDLQLQIQKRKTIEQELIRFQRLYDTMIHNFPDGIIGVLNRDMKYVLIEGKDLHEVDLPALGLTGQKASELQDPVVAAETISQIKKAFEGQSVSFEVKTHDRYYNIAAVPLPDAQNEINEILCVLKNVTERKQMEDNLVKALEKEKELGELKSRFVTMASHEFKTPLATILSSTFLLENYSGEDFEKEKMVHTDRIRRSVRKLTMILNEFLSLEKLEENQVTVVNVEMNIPKFIQSLISEIEPTKQQDQVISYNHTGNQQVGFLDSLLTWSIVSNLISNSLKYSRPGDRIDVNSDISGDLITIKVRDPGIGIPPGEHQNIFGRFFRASNTLNFDGTGLGLHIVEKNVKLLGGTIAFTSQLNGGTEFTVILPRDSNHEAEAGF